MRCVTIYLNLLVILRWPDIIIHLQSVFLLSPYLCTVSHYVNISQLSIEIDHLSLWFHSSNNLSIPSISTEVNLIFNNNLFISIYIIDILSYEIPTSVRKGNILSVSSPNFNPKLWQETHIESFKGVILSLHLVKKRKEWNKKKQMWYCIIIQSQGVIIGSWLVYTAQTIGFHLK